MKILISYHHFPHYRKGVFSELARRNSETLLLTSELHSFRNIPSMLPDTNFKFSFSRAYWWCGLHFQPRLVYESFFGNHDAFVFLANPNFISTWMAALVARVRGKRVVFWVHGFFSYEKTLKNQIRRLFFSLANCFYSYGYRSKLIAKSFGFLASNLYVGFNSLDYISQIRIRERMSGKYSTDYNHNNAFNLKDSFKVICVSRITKICHYELLFHAVDMIRKSTEIITEIVMVGDGLQRSYLESLASELGLQVKFLGAIYDEEKVASLIHSADVTVSPGKVGLTAMHSLMFGTPVITHNNMAEQMPEVEAIVNDVTGILFKQNDVKSLANALIRASEIFSDKCRVRENCYAVIDQLYNPRKQVDVLMAAIKGIPAVEGDDMFQLGWIRNEGLK